MQSETEVPTVRVLWLSRNPSEIHATSDVLARNGASVTRVASARAALDLLDGSADSVPHCLFVDPSIPGLNALLEALRGQPDFSHLPVVYVTSRVDAGVLAWARSVGADDVHWLADEDYLADLVEGLREFHPSQRPEPKNGIACVLHPHQERRRSLGRLFRNAGFAVCFGGDELDLVDLAERGSTPDILVASGALLNASIERLDALRAVCDRPSLPCILIEDGELEAAGRPRPSGELVAWMDGDAPAEHALFLANELLGRRHASLRRSPRLPHHGLCSYRASGALTYRFASLYNISRTGLYVRTLVPVPKGTTVHVELTLPSDEIVHLAGVVAWRRSLGSEQQLAPPGFGLQLLASQCAPTDLAAYVAAYEALAQSRGRSRSDSAIRQTGVQAVPAATA